MKTKCFKKPNFYFDVDEETYAPSIAEQFECVIGALGEASKANDMTNEWMEYEPQFKQHLNAWKQCSNAGGKLQTILYDSMNLTVD